MQYLLSVVHDLEGWSATPEVMAAVYKDVSAYNQELQALDKMVFGGGLTPFTEAKTFEYKASGEVAMTDGPFAETKEQLGGFWVIKADSEEEAIEWTRKASIACRGKVELRPFQKGEG